MPFFQVFSIDCRGIYDTMDVGWDCFFPEIIYFTCPIMTKKEETEFDVLKIYCKWNLSLKGALQSTKFAVIDTMTRVHSIAIILGIAITFCPLIVL